MLHRSFKPAKCKTSLKLAASRIKLLKNKKEVQLKQLRSELAQLLESGHDRTARIRVEHVVREEKMMTAYELIGIYCELIVARMPVIESQKDCPIDLKEAITSIIFATPRCADIPELLDVRKHLTTKYGKEFVSAAVELRPGCGVNRMLVEKLSVVAPDGQTKIKILTAIAEEHNIKWDPNSFEERNSKLSDDLLSGPNTFEKSSKMNAESSNFFVPNVQAAPFHEQKYDPTVNSYDQSLRSPMSSQNVVSTDIGGTKTTISQASHPEEARPSEYEAERMQVRQSSMGKATAFSLGKQNWNMEFEDATSAAQAAAESAERASMAARAAAELSSLGKITRQYSRESQNSSAHGIRDEGSGKYATSPLPHEHVAKDFMNGSFYDRNPSLQNENIHGNECDDKVGAPEGFSEGVQGPTKTSSGSASFDDDTLVNRAKKVDGHSQKSSSENKTVKPNEGSFFSEKSVKKKSRESEVECVSEWQAALKSENLDYFGEERIRKQSGNVSSRSDSSTFGGDHNVAHSSYLRYGSDDGKDSFMGVDKGNIHKDSRQTSTYENASVTFDESDSDDDGYKFDLGPSYDEQVAKFYFPSPVRESPAHPLPNADSWSLGKNRSGSSSQPPFSTEWYSSPEFPESLTKSADPSNKGNFPSVIFDDSDDSKSESELEKSKHGGAMDSNIPLQKHNVYSINWGPKETESQQSTRSSFVDEGNGRYDMKSSMHSSSDDSNSVKLLPKCDLVSESKADYEREKSFGQLSATQMSARTRKYLHEVNGVDSQLYLNSPLDEVDNQRALQSSILSSFHEVKDNVCTPQSPEKSKENEFLNQSSSESGKEFYVGTLTGGLRDRVYSHPPPYSRSASGDASSSSKLVGEDRSSTTPVPLKSTNGSKKSGSGAPIEHYDSDSDSSKEKIKLPNLGSKQRLYNQNAGKQGYIKSRLSAPGTFSDSDNDSEEDFQEETSTSRAYSESGFSRRTNASFANSQASHSKPGASSEASTRSNSGAVRKLSMNSYGSETLHKSQFQPVSSGHRGGTEQLNALKLAASELVPEPKFSLHGETLKPLGMEQSSNPLKKTLSGSSQSPKASNSAMEAPSRDNSIKKASHVHPKLPDYDTLAARLQSLRDMDARKHR